MRYADLIVGVEYQLAVPRRPAPTFEFIQGRLSGMYSDGNPWDVIGKQDGWAMCRTNVEDLDPRTTVGELQAAMARLDDDDGFPQLPTIAVEVVARVKPVRIKRTWAQREFDHEVFWEMTHGPLPSSGLDHLAWDAAKERAEEAVIARRLDIPDSR